MVRWEDEGELRGWVNEWDGWIDELNGEGHLVGGWADE